MLVCVFFTHFAHGTAGAARIRHFLLPLLSRDTKRKPRASPAARMWTCACCLKFESKFRFVMARKPPATTRLSSPGRAMTAEFVSFIRVGSKAGTELATADIQEPGSAIRRGGN